MNIFKLITLVAIGFSLAACTTANRISNIGKAPVLTAIENPTTQAGYKPVNMPMPEPERVAYSPNSLFISGTRGFFKDQRASKVGDILTVLVTISDKAQLSNKSSRSRSSTNDAGAGGVVGSIFNQVAPNVNANAAIELKSGTADSGNGSVDRAEKIETQVAAVVVQVLPNGNLVIEGRQEVRVNFEVRDLIVMGIVRPEDIGAQNTVPSSKIAQARISYGGRGQITDVQQPRYGQQFMDAILPF
jgi:flagellar L-ring protein precursor FlgH